MKKLNTLIVLLALSAGVFAQGPFTIVSWVSGSLADDPTAVYYDTDFSVDAYPKMTVEALKAKSSFTVDVAAIDDLGIQDIWSRLGDVNLISNLTSDGGLTSSPFDLDANGDGTYGGAWKAFYDDQNLYVLMKYVDANGIVDALTTDYFEICFQTKATDRYEAGFQAATSQFGVDGSNAQYGRFIELGGGKAVLTPDGISKVESSKGQTGDWASGLGSANTPEYSWNPTQDGTIWAMVAFNFADYMMYMTDEWGAYDASNYVAFDPTAIPTIAFEMKTGAKVGTETNLEYWWNSDLNDSYAFVYFNGLLHFSDQTFDPVGVEKYMKPADKSAFIYDNILKFKGYDSPVNVDIYSVVGQKVKSATNVSTLSVADLNNGLYIVKVGDDVFKVMK